MIQFLADENVEWSIVTWMRAANYDVLAVKEIFPGAEDDRVLKFSVKEQRILITNDMDFGGMIFHQQKNSPGVILMRFSQESSEKKKEVLGHLLKFHTGKLQHHFVVISENQIKIRPIK